MKLFHIVLEDVDGVDQSGFATAGTAQEAMDLHVAFRDLDAEHFEGPARVFEIPTGATTAAAICWDALTMTELDL